MTCRGDGEPIVDICDVMCGGGVCISGHEPYSRRYIEMHGPRSKNKKSNDFDSTIKNSKRPGHENKVD